MIEILTSSTQVSRGQLNARKENPQVKLKSNGAGGNCGS